MSIISRFAFVNYEKAFDSIETWAVLQSLQLCQIDYRYIKVLKGLYKYATVTVRFKTRTRNLFSININGEHITQTTDDIVVMAEIVDDLGTMLDGLNKVSQRVGLKMNMDKI